MYNFNEIRSLSELKELCFYIKAINGANLNVEKLENFGEIRNYLNKEYNLEISVSKLYLFVQKIVYMYNRNEKFPTLDKVDDIIKSYIKFIKDRVAQAEFDIVKSKLRYTDPKHTTIRQTYCSTEQLVDGIDLKKKLYKQKMTSMLIWSAVLALFGASISCCLVGIIIPSILEIFTTVSHKIVAFLFLNILLFGIIYGVNLLINYKYLKPLKMAIWNFDINEIDIRYDLMNLSETRHKLVTLKEKISINGVEMSEDMMYKFLANSDDLDIKFYSNRLKAVNSKEKQSLPKVNVGQVLSKREQNISWKNSEQSKIEKQNINKELVSRITNLADFLKEKKIADVDLASAISKLYCNDLSISARNNKINEAESKVELYVNYLAMVDKILQFEKFNLFEKVRTSSKLKMLEMITEQEKQYFIRDINLILSRIEKTSALNLLSQGQEESYKRIRNNFNQGLIQGAEIDCVEYRYDLAKLYLKIYDELSIYDMLS